MNYSVILHIHTEEGICTKFAEFPQYRDGHGKAQCKNCSCCWQIFSFYQKVKKVCAQDCKHDTTADVQQLIPYRYGIVKLPTMSQHRSNGIRKRKQIHRQTDSAPKQLFQQHR